MAAQKTRSTSNRKKQKSSAVRLVNIELYSINGQQLPFELNKELNLNRQNTLDLIEATQNVLKIKLSEHLFFKPEGPFKLDLEVIGTYESESVIEPEEIDLETLARPLFSYASLVIGQVTERFGSIPVIVPPRKTKD